MTKKFNVNATDLNTEVNVTEKKLAHAFDVDALLQVVIRTKPEEGTYNIRLERIVPLENGILIEAEDVNTGDAYAVPIIHHNEYFLQKTLTALAAQLHCKILADMLFKNAEGLLELQPVMIGKEVILYAETNIAQGKVYLNYHF